MKIRLSIFGYIYVVVFWVAMYIKAFSVDDNEAQAYTLIYLGVTVLLVAFFMLLDRKNLFRHSLGVKSGLLWVLFDFLVFAIVIVAFLGKNLSQGLDLIEWIGVLLGYFIVLKLSRVAFQYLVR